MGPILHTERCVLRPWAPDDAEVLGAILRDPTVRRYLLDDQLVDRHWVLTRIGDSWVRFAHGGFGMWTIGVDGAVVGFVGFLPAHDPPVLELAYGLHPSHHGRGLATEAADAVISHYVGAGHTPVRASTDEPNAASRRVLERLGFRLTDRTEATEDLPAQLHFERPG